MKPCKLVFSTSMYTLHVPADMIWRQWNAPLTSKHWLESRGAWFCLWIVDPVAVLYTAGVAIEKFTSKTQRVTKCPQGSFQTQSLVKSAPPLTEALGQNHHGERRDLLSCPVESCRCPRSQNLTANHSCDPQSSLVIWMPPTSISLPSTPPNSQKYEASHSTQSFNTFSKKGAIQWWGLLNKFHKHVI